MTASDSEDLHLRPFLAEAGKFDKLIEANRTLSATISPLDDSLAVHLKATKYEAGKQPKTAEHPIYFAKRHKPPSMERRLFVTDTLVIFEAFRDLLKSAETETEGWLQTPDALTMLRKLGIDYVNFIKECWVHASQPISRPEPLQFPSEHYRILYTTFSLFVLLYLSEPEFEDAPIGDELLEWLNIHFIEPSTEEGDHLSKLEKPWEDQTFWSYLVKCIVRGLTKAAVFFLDVLSKHPSFALRDMTKLITPLISSQPRLQNYSSEREFAYAARRWRDKVKALRVELNKIPEKERTVVIGERDEDWWEKLSDIVGVLEGRFEVVKRIVDEEFTGDWKDAVVAYGMFVNGRMRRQDLPDVLAEVLDDMPPDPTNIEESLHVALLSGNLKEALQHAQKLDPWLSAHLADIMVPLQLIDTEPDEESGLSLRDYHILTYADYLRSDAGLWRVVVDYMYSCDDIGKQQADEVLLRVPLRLYDRPNLAAGELITEEREETEAVVGVLKELNEACSEYQREATRRTICRVAAKSFVAKKDYGLAVAYCASAEDWAGLGRVVDYVLEEYIISGPQSFVNQATAISSTIQELYNRGPSHWVFYHRFMFVTSYAKFQEAIVNKNYASAAKSLVTIISEEVAPRAWGAILLNDAIPLLQHNEELVFNTSEAIVILQKLEEVFTGVNQGAEEDYLSLYMRLLAMRRLQRQESSGKEDGETEGMSMADALSQLGNVRLFLARYFARCTVMGNARGITVVA
ncbi:hypothetical protein Agabi119p4_6613 [Agaricus bisporus var. burnettii]|uniref:Nuclear pore complex protein Nup85 n=1 Tax=Agaricus bisporus var. burnettii TaxID=192524 RepID=A0A8H7C8Y9_AGABI|nr:hypothetical protein Agabi119p4_6613 [Agaricus bisporus var. burnettii]